jgi:uncharacterized protein (TIGR02466 family)
MNLAENHFFCSPIYFDEKKEWVEKLNLASDSHVLKARESNKKIFVKNFAVVHHSESLIQDKNFEEFLKYINSNAFDILNNQGFDLTNYILATTDLWVQEFSSLGGGNHSPHIHWNGHISGFYFLKCSDKTSYPIFHDPRSGRMMNLLPEKDLSKITLASSSFHFKPKPGTFIFFNSYLQHEFAVDHGIEPFRFIHFNIQAFPKQLINGNFEKINDS